MPDLPGSPKNTCGVQGSTDLPLHYMEVAALAVETDATAKARSSQVPYSLYSRKQKIAITLLVSLTSILSPMSATIYIPALSAIAADLHVTVSLVNLSVTSYLIFQGRSCSHCPYVHSNDVGLSPSLWGSLTDVLGRRPVYLGTLIIYIAACLGLAFTTNYTELIVLRCLQSTGSASTIAIGAGVIADITERRERGGYIGLYSAGALVGNAIGPVLGGIFAETSGWHSIFYFLAVFAGVLDLCLFLVFPETLRAIVGNGSVEPKPSYFFQPVISWLCPRGTLPISEVNPRPPRKRIDLLGPLKMMAQKDVFCGLIFTGLYYTIWQSSLVASATLFKTQYGLSEISIGLTFIANGVGCISASLLTGKVLNHDYRRLQRIQQDERNSSGLVRVSTATLAVDHIEHARLIRLPWIVLLFLAGTLAFGWCIQARTTIALPIIWTFCSGFTSTAIMSMFSTLIVDWYPNAGASATAAINLVRCLLGAGGISVVQPMINVIGVGSTFTVGASICIVAAPLGLLVYVRGEHWRVEREKDALSDHSL